MGQRGRKNLAQFGSTQRWRMNCPSGLSSGDDSFPSGDNSSVPESPPDEVYGKESTEEESTEVGSAGGEFTGQVAALAVGAILTAFGGAAVVRTAAGRPEFPAADSRSCTGQNKTKIFIQSLAQLQR